MGNENEPRDEHGRWEGNGGSPAHAAGHAESVPSASPHEGKAGSFKEGSSGDLAKQGFTPTTRASGRDVTGAARVGWHQAQVTGRPQTLTHTGRGGLTLLRAGDRLPYGQSHMVVTPAGRVTQFHPK